MYIPIYNNTTIYVTQSTIIYLNSSSSHPKNPKITTQFFLYRHRKQNKETMSGRKQQSKTRSRSPVSATNTSDDDPMLLSPVSTSNTDKGSTRSTIRKESEHRRRLMMNQYYDELVTLLSMVCDRITPRRMDKSSTLQETVGLIRLYYDLEKQPGGAKIPSKYKPEFMNRGEATSFLLDALNAFLMLVSDNGCILYTTDFLTSLTGHLPTRTVGQSIYDCIHEESHLFIKSMFQTPPPPTNVADDSPIIAYPSTSFKCQFKIYNTDTTSLPAYQRFSCLAYLRKWKEVPEEILLDINGHPNGGHPSLSCLLILGKLDSNNVTIDCPITSNEANFQFDFRISKEAKVLDLSEHASLVLGYTSMELVGSVFFDYVDPMHLYKLSESFSMFMNKGLGVSKPYRLMTKSGRYIWVVSKGFLSYNPWNHKPDHILLQCKVLGCDEILSECRFLQDKQFLPDMSGLENYKPLPINIENRSALVERTPTVISGNLSVGSQNVTQSPLLSPLLSQQSPLLSQQSSLLSQQSYSTSKNSSGTSQSLDQSLLLQMFSQSEPFTQQKTPAEISQLVQTHYHPQIPAQCSQTQARTPAQYSETQAQTAVQYLQNKAQTPVQYPEMQVQTPVQYSQTQAQTPVQYSQTQGQTTAQYHEMQAQTPVQYSQKQAQTPIQYSETQGQYSQTQAQTPVQSSSQDAVMKSVDEIRRELDRKNHELFEMQKRILAQQQLIEQERHQFYRITNQVMSYISSQQQPSELPRPPAGSTSTPLDRSLHPNILLAMQNSKQPQQQQEINPMLAFRPPDEFQNLSMYNQPISNLITDNQLSTNSPLGNQTQLPTNQQLGLPTNNSFNMMTQQNSSNAQFTQTSEDKLLYEQSTQSILYN